MLLKSKLLCLISMAFLLSCTKISPGTASSAPIFVPDSVRYPKKYKYQNSIADKYGVYDCENNLYQCITYHDRSILEINTESLYSAFKQLLYLVDEHNHDYRMDEHIDSSEIKCGFFDFKCKKEKNGMEGK